MAVPGDVRGDRNFLQRLPSVSPTEPNLCVFEKQMLQNEKVVDIRPMNVSDGGVRKMNLQFIFPPNSSS